MIMVVHEISFVLAKYDSKLKTFSYKFQTSSFSDSLLMMKDKESSIKILGYGNKFCVENFKFLIVDKVGF